MSACAPTKRPPWPDRRRVLIVSPPGTSNVDLALALDVFDRANEFDGSDPFFTLVVSVLPSREIRLTDSLAVLAGASFRSISPIASDMVLVLGSRAQSRSVWPTAFLNWLSRCSVHSAQIVAVGRGRHALTLAGIKPQYLSRAKCASGVDPLAVSTAVSTAKLPEKSLNHVLGSALALVEQSLDSRVARKVSDRVLAEHSLIQPLLADGARMPPDHRLESVLQFIEAHLSADLGIPLLAREAAMSPRSLTRWFVREIGITPRKYVQQRRIQRAVEYLTETDWSVKRISLSLGYRSTETFRRALRQQTGKTPSRIRLSG